MKFSILLIHRDFSGDPKDVSRIGNMQIKNLSIPAFNRFAYCFVFYLSCFSLCNFSVRRKIMKYSHRKTVKQPLRVWRKLRCYQNVFETFAKTKLASLFNSYYFFLLQLTKWQMNTLAMPMGQMPVLEVDGRRVHQSLAMCRYVAKQVGVAGKDAFEDLQIDAIVDTINEFRLSKRHNKHNQLILY